MCSYVQGLTRLSATPARPSRGPARAHSRPVSGRRAAVPGGRREHSGRESLGVHIPPLLSRPGFCGAFFAPADDWRRKQLKLRSKDAGPNDGDGDARPVSTSHVFAQVGRVWAAVWLYTAHSSSTPAAAEETMSLL